MQLLVSVRSRQEALSALGGGADIIDAKEPAAGALGAVSLPTFASIVEAVSGSIAVSAALGDADDEHLVSERVRAFGRAGAAFVKIGFAGFTTAARVESMIMAARVAAIESATAVVAVAYADFASVGSLSPEMIGEAARAASADGVLLDTAGKNGPGLLRLMSERQLRAWVGRAQAAGMFAALAGQLRAADLAALVTAGADIVGVRGAVCDGDRNGDINAGKVRTWSARVRDQSPSLSSTAGAAAALARSTDRPPPLRWRRPT
jgi:(5-formylfuran-3-yl)methyl phosphate synthase